MILVLLKKGHGCWITWFVYGEGQTINTSLGGTNRYHMWLQRRGQADDSSPQEVIQTDFAWHAGAAFSSVSVLAPQFFIQAQIDSDEADSLKCTGVMHMCPDDERARHSSPSGRVFSSRERARPQPSWRYERNSVARSTGTNELSVCKFSWTQALLLLPLLLSGKVWTDFICVLW